MFAATMKQMAFFLGALILATGFSIPCAQAADQEVKAYLAITMVIAEADRPAAAKIYNQYKGPFLSQIKGALSKALLVRKEDVQVLHGFASLEDAQAYLKSAMFNDDVFVGLKGLWKADPDVRIYLVF